MPRRACQFLFLFLIVAPALRAADGVAFFEAKVRPLLIARCYECHSAEKEIKGELALDTKAGWQRGGEHGAALVPGKPDDSLLIKAVSYGDPDLQMPPKKRLTAGEVEILRAWVDMGAPDPRIAATARITPLADKYEAARAHWAFQPVQTPSVPQVSANAVRRTGLIAGPQTPIDNFIVAKLVANGLQLSPPADKRTLIRRASFDLTGLPPSPEEVAAFVKDETPGAFARVVDRLLASPHYGERWGRYWLDVARFADTKGYVYSDREESKFIHSSAYRDWVIGAFNHDLPYDRFITLQIAADQAPGADLDSLAAMGYLTLGRRFFGVVHDIIDDRIDVVMRGTQGLTVGCARCHDHKFDPIPTKDYYSLYGVFAGCTEREVPLNSGPKPAGAYLEFEKELKLREDKFQTLFNEKKEEQSRRLRAKTTDYLVAVLGVEKLPTEEFYSIMQADEVNPVMVRAWHKYLLSTAKASHPIWAPWHAFAALPANEFVSRAGSIIASATHAAQKLNPLVANAFAEKTPLSMREVAEVYGKLLTGLEKKWSANPTNKLSKPEEELRQVLYAADSPASVPAGAIVDLEWYFDEPTRVALGKLSSQIEQWILQSPGAPPYAVILEDRAAIKNPRVFKRGNPANQGEETPRQFVKILAGENRQPFAKGSGRLDLAEAIASKDNPLTARVFVNRLWLHHFGAGLVSTPSDFGTRAEPPTHPELLDWLARYFMDNGWSVKKVHRLIMLSAVYQQASDAPTDVGGYAKEIDPENKLLWRMNRQRLDFEALRDSLLSVSGQLDPSFGGKAEDLFKAPFSKRRSVYGFIDRQFLPGALRAFDFANPDMHNPQRSETTVPQQALFFMNSPFVVEQARALAARAGDSKEAAVATGKSSEARIEQIHHLVYQREPTAREMQGALRFIAAATTGLEEKADQAIPSAWTYGFGEFDETNKQLKIFKPLPYFNGEAWQGGESWPDAKLGWAQLTATGGHAGNDLQHAVIRRWISPVAGSVAIEGNLQHQHPEGDGIRAWLISSRQGLLGNWVVHNQSAETKIQSVVVKQGDTIDFVVSIHQSLNKNAFLWSPIIRMTGPEAIRDANGYAREWNAPKEFGGAPAEVRKPLTPWEQYAQVLLLGNEFLFVD